MKLRTLILIAVLLISNCGRDKLPFELKEERRFQAGFPMDIHYDNIDELLRVSWYNMALFDQKGKFIWDFYFPDPKLKRYVSITDFNKDGLKEIFLSISEDLTRILECYGSAKPGDLIKRFYTVKGEDKKKDGKWDGEVMAVGGIDANDDGKLDLLLRSNCGFDLQPRGLVTYDMNTGKEIWHYWIGPQIYDVILEDLDNDEKPEIVIGTYSPYNGSVANNTVDWESYVIVLDRKGNLLWKKKTGEYFTQTLVAVSDIDKDDKKEVITALFSRRETKESDTLFILEGETGKRKKFISTGETFWGLLCADVNRDGKDEILTGNSDGKLRVFNSDLDEIRCFQNNTGIDLMGVCDLNGDGRNEIISTTEDNKLIIFDEKLKRAAQLKLEKGVLHGRFGENFGMVKPVRAGKQKKILIQIPKVAESEFVLYSFMPIAFAGGKGVLPIIIPLIILIVFLSYLYARKAVIPKIQFPTTELLEKAKEGYILLSKKGKVLFANDSAEEILGAENLVGEKLKEKLTTATKEIIEKDEGQIIIKTPEGEKILKLKRMKIKKGFILRIEDITKEEHLKRIENWAPVAQKLAHGIKNPLSTILGAVEQLEIKYNKEEGVKRYIELVKEEILRLKKMSDAFMKFTKLSPPMFQPKNINELIKNVMTRYETICTGTGIKVEYELDNNLPLILIDEEGIANVLNIIIENGIEAMEKGGILRIKTATMERFEKEAEKIKNYLRIEVSDTGKGIPEKYLNKVFDPYFTYDKPFGTGLGLTLAKRIVENHKGFIEITSKEGVGTTVSVYLPLNQNV